MHHAPASSPFPALVPSALLLLLCLWVNPAWSATTEVRVAKGRRAEALLESAPNRLPNPLLIDRITINPGGLGTAFPREVEILVNPAESIEEDEWVSLGLFDLGTGTGPVSLEFEPEHVRGFKFRGFGAPGRARLDPGPVSFSKAEAEVHGIALEDKSGKPLPEVKVSVDSGPATVSGPDGSFSLGMLPRGTVEILALLPGYDPVRQTLHVPAVKRADVTLRLVPRDWSIFGILLDANRERQIGRTVSLFPAKGTAPLGSALSDAFGAFLFEGIAPGRYRLSALTAGPEGATAEVVVPPEGHVEFTLVLPAMDTEEVAPNLVRLSPWAHSPNDPARLGSPARFLYLTFDQPVDDSALDLTHYEFTWLDKPPAGNRLVAIPASEIRIKGAVSHKGDPSGATVRFELEIPASRTTMPFLTLRARGVRSRQGVAIDPDADPVANFSEETFELPEGDEGR